MHTKPGQSGSFAQIERLAVRTLRSVSLPDSERSDLEEIVQIARRGREAPSGSDHETATGPDEGGPAAAHASENAEP